jgi:hypothetical protein
MTKQRFEQIIGLLDQLSKDVMVAREYDLAQTERLLSMAKLDLQMTLYAISESELRDFTCAASGILNSLSADDGGDFDEAVGRKSTGRA